MRIIISLFGIILMVVISHTSYAFCDLGNFNAVDFLQGCANDGDPANAVSNGNYVGADGVLALLQTVGERLIAFGSLFAIGAIVYSGILYTTSYGDDEKIKKAKMTGVYALIGLLLLGTAFPFIDTVVAFIYSLGG